MPCQLAAFPKCFLEQMMAGEMPVFEWIELASTIPHVTGVELYPYPPALESWQPEYLKRVRAALEEHGLQAPMICASPDFTRPDAAARKAEGERQRQVIDVAAALGASTCRALSGQRRPQVTREDGIAWTVGAIKDLLPQAALRGVKLALENHYKDGFWEYPEFAQQKDVYLTILGQLDSPFFGVNYDPSNALIAGDDPYGLLDAVKERVVSMHASDRSLQGGTLQELHRLDADPMTGYAGFVKHGVIGQGLIDYDRIFSTLQSAGFSGWISIEDGQDPDLGMEHLRESAEFLWRKMKEWHLADAH